MSKSKISFWHPASLICTCFGVGKIPFAPGTWGSLFAFPLIAFVHYLVYNLFESVGLKSYFFTDWARILLEIFFVMGVFFSGWYYSNIYIKITGRDDPKEVVIDEVCGQAIALFLSLFIIFGFFYTPQGWGGGWHSLGVAANLCIYSFITFRFFDIVKRGPVGWIDKNVKGGLGVMLDDVVAGILAGITSALIFLVL